MQDLREFACATTDRDLVSIVGRYPWKILVTKALLYPRFWEKFLRRLRETHLDWTGALIPPSRGWIKFRSTFPLTYPTCGFAAGGRLRSEFLIDSGDKERNRRIFESLLNEREVMEGAYGRSLNWESLPHARMCRVADYRGDGDVTFQDRHDEYIDWFLDAGVRLRRASAAIEPLSSS